MADQLPGELIDRFFAEFPTDRAGKRAIGEFGLVCKQWLPPSRYRFFSDVDLDARSIKPFLDVVTQSPFPVPNFIRSLGLSSSGLEQGLKIEDCLTLGPFVQVTTLRLTMTQDVLERNYALLGNTFRGVTTLVFRNVPLPLDSILLVVSTFPALKSVVLDWVSLSYDHDTIPHSTYQFPPQWDSLTMDLNDRPEPFFRGLLRLPQIPIFSSLSLRGVYPFEGSHFARYLAHAGSALQYIRFEAEASGEFGERAGRYPVGLSASTGLRHLEMVFTDYSGIAETVHSALTYLKSSSLVSVNVVDASGPITTPRPVRQNWDKLDNILRERRFSTLQSFRVQTKTRELGMKISQRMPFAGARGILRVIYE
ncbi:hypothetical protein B0H16DRAFT_1728019 [Mycena metata]|uniref:Uncharacterized protein n=1 Tax=Mycena metata TaxID=1033252 RepID=A0AAD7II89_9AGAR|nr:hypothetical protein B0H16DRAFT_1728019 [Mycena metata]